MSVFVAMGAWTAASPLMSSPDEPAHVVRAASLVRGQLVGSRRGGPSSPSTVVQVPAWLSGAGSMPSCYAGRPQVPASCAPALGTAGGTVAAVTYAGRYPPLYYAIVGWPTLLVRGPVAVYLMRLAGAAACAALLAGALWCAGRSRARNLLLVALGLTATPQVLFLGGVVNPSGLEISAAICAWTAGLAAWSSPAGRGAVTGASPAAHSGQEGRGAPPPHLDRAALAWLVVSLAVLVNVRGLSPLFGALIGLTLLARAGRRGLSAALATSVGRIGAALVAAAGAVAVAWVLGAGALHVVPSGQRLPDGSGPLAVVVLEARNVVSMAPQFVGVFGWVDTYMPIAAYGAWLGGLAALVVLALRRARGRSRALLAVLALACAAVPILLTSSQAAHLGIFGQARDWMPLWVGLPLLAGASLRPSPEGRRGGRGAPAGAPRWAPAGAGRRARSRMAAATATAAALGSVQLLAWAWALHRYRGGLGPGSGHGTPGPAGLGPWAPPAPELALGLALAVALAAAMVSLVLEAREPHRSRAQSLPGATAPGPGLSPAQSLPGPVPPRLRPHPPTARPRKSR